MQINFVTICFLHHLIINRLQWCFGFFFSNCDEDFDDGFGVGFGTYHKCPSILPSSSSSGQFFLSGSVCTASISISISWFTFSCSFLIERNVPIISSSFGSIYSSFNSDLYRTRRWWLVILPTIIIFISQDTSGPAWTRGLLL